MEEQTAKPTKTKKPQKVPVAEKAAAAPVAADAALDPQLTNEELLDKVRALEAKVAAGEEAALKRVCSALGVDPSKVGENESKADTTMIRLHVSPPVNINGRVYQGIVEVPAHVAEVIQENLGKRRMRLIRESVGSKYLLEEGSTRPVLVEQVNADGERIR